MIGVLCCRSRQLWAPGAWGGSRGWARNYHCAPVSALLVAQLSQDLKVLYRVYNSPPLGPILGRSSEVRILYRPEFYSDCCVYSGPTLKVETLAVILKYL
jgi:hypothetical protein